MKILEYDQVDPVQVVYLTQLALDFALTPEMAAHIRRSDPRALPGLAIYALKEEAVLGQAGLFRLPLISTAGREDVGGLWAVAIHPQLSGPGVASVLLEEAHALLRAAGLRFSVAAADRDGAAHRLFRQHGYEETHVWATALARWETAHQPTRLRAEPAGPGGYERVEGIFPEIAGGSLGFAWRPTPFEPLRRVNPANLWVLQENRRDVGYAIIRADPVLLSLSNLALRPGIDPAEAVAAVAAERRSAYVQVKASRPAETGSLQRAGYHVAQPSRCGFLIRPLVPEVSVEDAWELFGVGSDRFLISELDVP